jgi:hypothetical protein
MTMPKSKQPRKRKPAATPQPQPPVENTQPEPSRSKTDVVVHSSATPVAPPFVVEVIGRLREVAGRMLDIADAAADALTKRLEGT